jgi:hypothetical protein
MRGWLGLCLFGFACGPAEAGPEAPPPDPPGKKVCTTADDCPGAACGRDNLCRPSGAGGAGLGELCADDEGCASAYCDDGVCSSLCGSCPSGAICSLDRLCRYRLAAPALSLGPVTTTVDGAQPVSFEVPADTGAVVVVIEDPDRLRVAARRLSRPDGMVLTDPFDAEAEIIPVASYPGAASVLIANTDDPRATPVPGAWQLTVGSYDPANFETLAPVPGAIERIHVLFEPLAEAGGTMDLELLLAPGTQLNAASATSTQVLIDLLDEVQVRLLEPIGAELGTVRYRDLPSDNDVIEDGNETRRLCEAHSRPGPHGTSINVAIVADLAYTSGHAGGSPGPPGIYGTPASCVVIERLGGARSTGLLMAHELGHYLGLRHTTELNGNGDPISDTPLCAAGTPVDQCPDYENLMFPTFPLGRELTLSPAQIEIARRSPWLYERPL